MSDTQLKDILLFIDDNLSGIWETLTRTPYNTFICHSNDETLSAVTRQDKWIMSVDCVLLFTNTIYYTLKEHSKYL